MTSSQEPPLTRRELRERERLREQQETSPTPDAAQAAPAQPVAAAPQTTEPQRPPVPPVQAAPPVQAPPPAAPAQVQPGYAAPRSAGAGTDPASPFGGAVVATPAGDPFASILPPPMGADTAMTPERTLTRRELRAMLDANSTGEFDELDFGDEPATQASPAPAPTANPFAPTPTPLRAPAPHQVADAAIADEPLIAPRPVGHWTDQLNAPVDQLLSRGGVSHGVPPIGP